MMRCMIPAPSEIVLSTGKSSRESAPLKLVRDGKEDYLLVLFLSTCVLATPRKALSLVGAIVSDSLGFFWPWPYQYTRKRESRR